MLSSRSRPPPSITYLPIPGSCATASTTVLSSTHKRTKRGEFEFEFEFEFDGAFSGKRDASARLVTTAVAPESSSMKAMRVSG